MLKIFARMNTLFFSIRIPKKLNILENNVFLEPNLGQKLNRTPGFYSRHYSMRSFRQDLKKYYKNK